MKNSRRDFLKTGVSLGLGFSLAGLGGRGSAASGRPNLLIILADQDRYPTHTPPLKRPTLDRLRRSGIEFQNAYCSYPLCSPSRATLITGKYPHQAGIFTNTDFYNHNPSLPPELPTIGRVFSQADYATAWFGKWHLCAGIGNSGESRKYGFERMRISSQLFGLGRDRSTIAHAADWIEGRKNSPRPWLCACSVLNPHDICYPALYSLYGQIPEYPVSLPPNFSDDAGKIYPPFAAVLKTPATSAQIPKTEKAWIAYLRHYCYFTELMDRQIGALLEALDRTGQMANTVVIYTSDHGEMAGSHGLVNKGMAMYEENIHVPLVFSRPGLAPAADDRLVSHLDLVPTLCGLAGIEWPEPLSGMDLTSVLAGKNVAPRETIFCEGQGELNTTKPWRGLRSGKWKYWQYLDGFEFLFDLETDPYEKANLAGEKSSQGLVDKFRERVRQFRRQTGDPFREFM